MQELSSSVSFSLPIFLSLLWRCLGFLFVKENCTPNAAFLNIAHLFLALPVCYNAASRFILQPFSTFGIPPMWGKSTKLLVPSQTAHKWGKNPFKQPLGYWRTGWGAEHLLCFSPQQKVNVGFSLASLKQPEFWSLDGGFEMWKQLAQRNK